MSRPFSHEAPPRLPQKPAAYTSSESHANYRKSMDSIQRTPGPVRHDTIRMRELLGSLDIDDSGETHRLPDSNTRRESYYQDANTRRGQEYLASQTHVPQESPQTATTNSMRNNGRMSMEATSSAHSYGQIHSTAQLTPTLTDSNADIKDPKQHIQRTFFSPADMDVLLEEYKQQRSRPSRADPSKMQAAFFPRALESINTYAQHHDRQQGHRPTSQQMPERRYQPSPAPSPSVSNLGQVASTRTPRQEHNVYSSYDVRGGNVDNSPAMSNFSGNSDRTDSARALDQTARTSVMPHSRSDSRLSLGRSGTDPALSPDPSLAPFSRASTASPGAMYAQRTSFDRRLSSPSRARPSFSGRTSPERSPDRLYCHPIQELEDFHGGSIPSPDRTQQFLDCPIIDSDLAAASVIPPVQGRRGRIAGEIINESDLPAMPPLFAEDENRRGLPRLPQPPAAYPPPVTTKASSPRTPNKRLSVSRAPDALQSVSVLPVKPFRRPPLCLEERFHPASFAKTNKFKIKVQPALSVFSAGGDVCGHIEISSDEGFRAQLGSTQVLVGEIGVEIIGFEEIQHAESQHEPRSLTFLYGKRVFQRSAELHPIRAEEEQVITNAVQEPADQDGYRVPSKGTTTFPFAFPLPVDAPSSTDKLIARIKYLVTGYATVKLQGSEEVIATSQSVRVVEAWDIDNPVYKVPIEASQGRDIPNYNEIATVAKLNQSLYAEGDTISGYIRVANHSSRKTKEVKVFLVNKITLFGDKRPVGFDVNPLEDFSLEETAATITEPHVISKGGEEVWKFSITVPTDKCISIRNLALFEITPFILIKISTGPLFKSTRLYIHGISIAHPLSLTDPMKERPPTAENFKWSNIPTLYRYQRLVDGQLTSVEKGRLEPTELITYINAHQRVMLLSNP